MGKNNSGRIYEFEQSIYPRLLWISIGRESSSLGGIFGEDIPDMDATSLAETMECTKQDKYRRLGVLIRFSSKSDMTVENISHESVHAALSIYFSIGEPVSLGGSNEPFAYLVGWISRCCHEARMGKVKCLEVGQ